MGLTDILIAFDKVLNGLIGGDANETLSSAAYRSEQQGYFWGRITRPLIDALLFWDKQHCYNAWLTHSGTVQGMRKNGMEAPR